MSNFGVIKSQILNKLADSYSKNELSDVKNILKSFNQDKNLVEMYLFYDEIETKHISNKETAKLFVEEIEKLLIEKSKLIKESCVKFSTILDGVSITDNEIYKSLDTISEQTTLLNLEDKIVAKEKLISHLSLVKNQSVTESIPQVDNLKLLNVVLVNNFNTKYSENISEEDKTLFKNIMSMNESEISKQMSDLINEMENKIDGIISEQSENVELREKLLSVKETMVKSEPNKVNYYKLLELKKGFN